MCIKILIKLAFIGFCFAGMSMPLIKVLTYLSRSSQSLGFLSFMSDISSGGFTGGLQKQNTNF